LSKDKSRSKDECQQKKIYQSVAQYVFGLGQNATKFGHS
jgi:hypothetical protein